MPFYGENAVSDFLKQGILRQAQTRYEVMCDTHDVCEAMRCLSSVRRLSKQVARWDWTARQIGLRSWIKYGKTFPTKLTKWAYPRRRKRSILCPTTKTTWVARESLILDRSSFKEFSRQLNRLSGGTTILSLTRFTLMQKGCWFEALLLKSHCAPFVTYWTDLYLYVYF